MSRNTRRRTLTDGDYQRLLEIRTGLRRFLHWSEEQAREAGLTPAQHQLLLAVRGHRSTAHAHGRHHAGHHTGPHRKASGGRPHPAEPTIGDLADHLLLRHHSAVQLVDRAAQSGLVTRRRDDEDHRIVHVSLTEKGSRILESLTAAHVEELARVGRSIADLSDPSDDLQPGPDG
jgi:DNA-binding MarR family transcriptional regulator